MARAMLVVLTVAIFVMYSRETSAQDDNCSRPNEVFNNCGSACPTRCGVPRPRACPQVCQPVCECRRGFSRNSNGDCVRGNACLSPPRK